MKLTESEYETLMDKEIDDLRDSLRYGSSSPLWNTDLIPMIERRLKRIKEIHEDFHKVHQHGVVK